MGRPGPLAATPCRAGGPPLVSLSQTQLQIPLVLDNPQPIVTGLQDLVEPELPPRTSSDGSSHTDNPRSPLPRTLLDRDAVQRTDSVAAMEDVNAVWLRSDSSDAESVTLAMPEALQGHPTTPREAQDPALFEGARHGGGGDVPDARTP